MIQARQAPGVAFDDRARELEPRACASPATVFAAAGDGASSGPAGSGLPHARPRAEHVAVRFRGAALLPAERRALAGLAGARLEDGLGPLRESRLDAPLAALRALAAAPTSPAAAVARTLLGAVEAASAPPAPPRIMGIVNVTPDSFSDGGRFLAPERAVEHGLALAAEGADLLDVGGESTRPGAEPVSAAAELARVLPVVEALAARAGVPVSVDTSKAAVARAAARAGATMVNDVTAGLGDPEMLPTVAELGVDYVAMHMRGTPRDMQRDPVYADCVAEVCAFLRARGRAALDAGIALERLLVDPGIGFGKRLEHNLDLLRRLGELRSLGRPLLVGPSRKSFLAALDPRGAPAAAERTGGTAAAVALAVATGAEILRVHDVAVMRQAAAVSRAVSLPAPPRPLASLAR